MDAANGGSFDNVQESFLFAEVMKYSYLIHAPVSLSPDGNHPFHPRRLIVYQDSIFQVGSRGAGNQFVFNTEAHPLKVVGPPV